MGSVRTIWKFGGLDGVRFEPHASTLQFKQLINT